MSRIFEISPSEKARIDKARRYYTTIEISRNADGTVNIIDYKDQDGNVLITLTFTYTSGLVTAITRS